MSYGTTAAQSTLSRYFAIIHLVHVGQSPLPQSLPWTWKFSIPLSLLSSPGLPQFSLIRDFGKQNIRGNVSKISVLKSCVLSTDRIEIHQSQPLVWPSDLPYVMLVGCDWWISIRSVDNMYDWRKFWKRFRGCFVLFVFESRVSTKTVVILADRRLPPWLCMLKFNPYLIGIL